MVQRTDRAEKLSFSRGDSAFRPWRIGLSRTASGLEVARFELKIPAKKDASRLGIAIAGNKAREIDLNETGRTQHLTGLEALVPIVQNNHAAFGQMLDSHFGTAPAKGTMIVDDDYVVLATRMIQQSF